MTDSETQKRMELAKRIAVSAGKLTLGYFQTDRFDVMKKGDGSPLTIADQNAEKHLRAEILDAFPDDAIIGEEFGETSGESGFRWILDPIDGTKSFISGVPLYGTMVGVEKTGNQKEARRSVIGSVYMPSLETGIYAMRGGGAWAFEGDQAPVRAHVSTKTELADSVFVTSAVEAFFERKAGDIYRELADRVYFYRTWGDAYGYYLVATGRVEMMIDPILNIWDAAAVQPIIEEAGGTFTDWSGAPRIDAGEAIGSNGHVHADLIAITKHATRYEQPNN
ncbi:MAG: histidinol-phosphatase [Mariniblastus sp.]|jgi:histidinol-phosphatase